MKRLFAIITMIASIAIFGANASTIKQTTTPVKGSVIDANGSAVGFATVSIERQDSTIVSATSADNDGIFSLNAPTGTYTLAVRLIGYKDHTESITIGSSPITLKPITLELDAKMLAGATVTEKVKLIEMKVDKLVMNVSQSAFAQGNNALDLIKKAPGVTVDKDGNVTLNGQAVAIWIDGRPSYMTGKSLEALLRSTSGTSIDKFEIMAHPSSKYDAQGQGGIINIKTKKNTLEGLYGNIGVTGGGMYFGEIDKFNYNTSAYANLSNYTGKSRTFLNVYESKNNAFQLESVSNILENGGNTFGQKSESLLQFYTGDYQAKVGRDWFLNSKNTVGVIAIVPASKGGLKTTPATSWADQLVNGEVIRHSTSNIDQTSKDMQAQANVNWTHVFNPMKAKEITFNADYYYVNTSDINDMVTYSKTALGDDESTRLIDTDRRIDIYSAKADYQSLIFSKYMFEAGAKWALSKTHNVMDHTETGAGAFNANTMFDYNELIGAAYFNVAGTIAKKFSAKVGVRAEYTNSRGDWTTAGEVSKRDYINLFPTAYVGYASEKGNRYTLSYTRRIGRPSYNQLNPTMNYMDANNYIVGDPNITPQYTSAFVLQTGFGQHFAVTALYNGVGDFITQKPEYDEIGNTIFRWSNFGRMDMAGFAFNVTELPIMKWLTWSLSTNTVYTWNKANDSDYTSNAPLFTGYTSLTATLPKSWKIQADATIQSSTAAAYFKVAPTKVFTLAVKKNVLSDKLILSMNVSDLFRTLSSDLRVNNVGGVKESYIGQKPFTQAVVFGVDWNFGKTQRVKARNVGDLEEASRTGASTKAGSN